MRLTEDQANTPENCSRTSPGVEGAAIEEKSIVKRRASVSRRWCLKLRLSRPTVRPRGPAPQLLGPPALLAGFVRLGFRRCRWIYPDPITGLGEFLVEIEMMPAKAMRAWWPRQHDRAQIFDLVLI